MTADPTHRYAVGDPDPTPLGVIECSSSAPARSRRLVCTWPEGHAHPQHVAGDGTRVLAVWDAEPDPAEPTVAAEHDADQRPGDRLPPRPHGPADPDVPEGVKLRPVDDTPLPEPASIADLAGLFAPDAMTGEHHAALARAKTIRGEYDHLLPALPDTDDESQTATLIGDLLLLAESRGQNLDGILDQATTYAEEVAADSPQEPEPDRFYALAAQPIGTTVRDADDPDRIGVLVRRTSRLWVDRDSKPPLVRWHGKIDAEPVPWTRLIVAAESPQEPRTR